MVDPKLSDALQFRLDRGTPEGVLDVIIELEHEGTATTASELRDAFASRAQSIEAAVAEAGGQVVETAWINSTVRARVPAAGLHDLSGVAGVTRLDIPHPLTAD
jgi:hypothetical protein